MYYVRFFNLKDF